ncbi:MAG: phosphoribosylanthranilate isomerase [Odoribacteraceae bacterium]|jgi:phosphoribosylanthranilate isomerase|nr:phosphoribosylanthranilate isomerase [Odoribacteraceae bacterium]
MKIKVCGTRDAGNIAALCALPVDMIGFVFHAPSPRHAGTLEPGITRAIPSSIHKVGVFVNASEEEVTRQARRHDLQAAQLHGDEPPHLCRALRERGLQVIKAIPMQAGASARALAAPYAGACDFLLFDTRTPARGGSGRKFDWRLLDAYDGPVPFLLGGGIGPEDATGPLRALDHPMLHAIDLNSRFETAPGIKDIRAIRQFITTLNAIKQ